MQPVLNEDSASWVLRGQPNSCYVTRSKKMHRDPTDMMTYSQTSTVNSIENVDYFTLWETVVMYNISSILAQFIHQCVPFPIAFDLIWKALADWHITNRKQDNYSRIWIVAVHYYSHREKRSRYEVNISKFTKAACNCVCFRGHCILILPSANVVFTNWENIDIKQKLCREWMFCVRFSSYNWSGQRS